VDVAVGVNLERLGEAVADVGLKALAPEQQQSPVAIYSRHKRKEKGPDASSKPFLLAILAIQFRYLKLRV
jgi:hypothetical protein